MEADELSVAIAENSPPLPRRDPEKARGSQAPVKAKRSPKATLVPEQSDVGVEELAGSRPPDPTQRPPEEDEIAAQVEALYPMPAIRPLMEIVDHWNHVPETVFPKVVTIRSPVSMEIRQAESVVGQSQLPAGSPVVPKALADGILTISTSREGAATATVPVDQTDFKKRIEEQYECYSKQRTQRVIALRASEQDRRLRALAHEAQLGTYNSGDDPRFAALKDSLRSGEAGFFELEAASKWRWAGKESVDGVEYDTAYAVMVSESAFGTAEREIKAMIRDGQVAKWIDVASGEEL